MAAGRSRASGAAASALIGAEVCCAAVCRQPGRGLRRHLPDAALDRNGLLLGRSGLSGPGAWAARRGHPMVWAGAAGLCAGGSLQGNCSYCCSSCGAAVRLCVTTKPEAGADGVCRRAGFAGRCRCAAVPGAGKRGRACVRRELTFLCDGAGKTPARHCQAAVRAEHPEPDGAVFLLRLSVVHSRRCLDVDRHAAGLSAVPAGNAAACRRHRFRGLAGGQRLAADSTLGPLGFCCTVCADVAADVLHRVRHRVAAGSLRFIQKLPVGTRHSWACSYHFDGVPAACDLRNGRAAGGTVWRAGGGTCDEL